MDGWMDKWMNVTTLNGWTGKQMDIIHIVSDIYFYIQLQTEIADKQREQQFKRQFTTDTI